MTHTNGAVSKIATFSVCGTAPHEMLHVTAAVRPAAVTCNISGVAVPRVLSELFQNPNYLYFISYMINTYCVSFKFRKFCKHAFFSLFTLKATGQIHST